MNSQEILLLNIGIVTVFGLWYWTSRKPKAPTQLNLTVQDSAPVLMEAEVPQAPAKKDYSKVTLKSISESTPTRDLSVVFIYNGHSWNAYEVLGVPAGAALRDVTDAFQIALRKADKDSHDFLTCAYQAILAKRSRL